MTAVLVCHDGAEWLPEVLDAIAAQTRSPDRIVAVDTGSTDETLAILGEEFGAATVVSLPRETPYGDAVQAGLESLGIAELPTDGSGPVEWIWLLHDDCAPDPRALDELLVRVTQAPSVWMVGPKVRGWGGPRLLEAGRTIDATGHIDTGVEGVELDQGQRDEVDEVLAVSTAAAMVRRDIWVRLGGLDPAWSAYGDDVDLGWRINAAGGRVVVAAQAVVRHVRAQTVGRRECSTQSGSPYVVRRRSGMQVVLTNTAPGLVPLLLARYLVGGALRALGLLVISRRPTRAAAELIAVGEVYLQPGLLVTGRRDRAGARQLSHHQLRHLFPTGLARWRSSPFRIARPSGPGTTTSRRTAVAETGPVAEESESLTIDDGVLARFLRRPATLLFVAMALLAFAADRHLLSTALHGGRLLPAPNGARDLWSIYTSSWHPSQLGSVTPAPPSIAVLAILSTLALGKVWLAVDVILLGVVPLSALSAFVAARGLTGAVRARVWVAIVYSLLPAVTGAVAGGRLDVAVTAILLPLVMRLSASAIRMDKGAWRRGVAAGLLLSVVVAFAPLLWLIALPALVIAVGFMAWESDQRLVAMKRLIAVAAILVVPLAVLVPWTAHVVRHPSLLLSASGLPEFYTAHQPPSGVALALLHAGGPAQPPIWIGVPILIAAILGLTRRSRLTAARTGGVLLVGGVALAVALTRTAGVTAGLPASRHWPGLALLVAGAGALLAILVAVTGARPRLRQQSFGWRQPAAAALVALAVVSTGDLAIGWVVRGADGPLSGSDSRVLPLFIQSELALKPNSPRALVLSSAGPLISYAIVRRPGGPQLGDAETAPPSGSSAAAAHLDTAVRDLVAGRPGAGAELTPFDIAYVVVPAGSTGRVSSALGRAATLVVVPAPGATVWRSSLPTSELTVLRGAAASAALAGQVPTDPHAVALPATPGSADVPYSSPVVGSIAVLAEPADRGWRATLDGKPLPRRTAYGWAQAFVLPAISGRLRISFDDGARSEWLWVELVAVVVAAVVAIPARRADDDPDGLS